METHKGKDSFLFINYRYNFDETPLKNNFNFDSASIQNPTVIPNDDAEQPFDQIRWIPRERRLRAKLTKFFASLNTTEQFQIQGYIGAESVEDANRRKIANEIKALRLFSLGIPEMKNGHVRSRENEVVRCLTITVGGKVVGAVYFTISLDTRMAYINTLQVDKNYQKKHFGYFLLHSAIYVALMYGCTQITLNSMQDVMPFYRNQGFIGSGFWMELDFTTEASRNLFLEAVKKSAPTSIETISKIIERAKSKHIQAKPRSFFMKYKPASRQFKIRPTEEGTFNIKFNARRHLA